jgi:predicted enzyme related to lactoylglutathione lyase
MANDHEFGLSAIGQIAINVNDVGRAEEFYRDKLGVKHLFSAPGMSFFDCQGVRLMLSLPEKPEFDHPSSILYFTVADIQDAFLELSARGVSFEREPHMIAPMGAYDLWMAFFRDSENNPMALMCNVPKA